jgi:hypothetical protein
VILVILVLLVRREILVILVRRVILAILVILALRVILVILVLLVLRDHRVSQVLQAIPHLFPLAGMGMRNVAAWHAEYRNG